MRRRNWLALPIISLALVIILVIWRPWLPWLEVGDVRINPKASVNPRKTYEVVVWDYEMPLPWSRMTHKEVLLQASQAFMDEHPNITVHMIVRPWDEGDGPFRDALEQGLAPDVLGMPTGVRFISSEYQVPLQHYLDDEQREDLLPGAQQGVTLKYMWAFPRLINPARWVIHVDRWPQDLLEPPAALTIEKWTEALATSRTKMGKGDLAANVLDPAFFYELMVGATGQTLFAADGHLGWPEESIRAVAEQLRNWVDKGFLSTDVEKASRTRLASFWDGRALAIAPTNTWLLHHLLQRAGALDSPQGDPVTPTTSEHPLEKVQRTVVWTPPPKIGDEVWVAATVSGYAVFRQASYKGDDHTRVACSVAAYLARTMSVWEAVHTFSVPAYRTALDEWLASSLLPKEDLHALLTWSMAAISPPIEDRLARLTNRVMVESVVPNLVSMLKGEMSPSHFASELQTIPMTAMSEIAVP